MNYITKPFTQLNKVNHTIKITNQIVKIKTCLKKLHTHYLKLIRQKYHEKAKETWYST